jgi:hypothetical protein
VCQSWISRTSPTLSPTSTVRQLRIRATSTSHRERASPGRFKATRAATTSLITWPCRLQRQGSHTPTCGNECSPSSWSAHSSVMTSCPLRSEVRQQCYRHCFVVDHHSLDQQRKVCRVFRAMKHRWQAHRQVGITSMGRDQE